MLPFRLRHADAVAGALLLAALAVVAVATFLVLRGSAIFESRVRYYTVFREGYGIAPGNSVTLLGIDVGRVHSVAIDDANRVRVDFDVRASFAGRVRDDTKAEVKSPPGLGGFIGGTGVKLTVGSPARPPVPAGGFVEGVNPVGLDEVLAYLKGEKTTDRVRAALENVERLIAALGAQGGPVQSMLRDLAAMTRDVREGRGALGQLWRDERLVAQVRGNLASVERILGGVEAIVKDTRGIASRAPETVARVNGLIDHVTEALTSATAILAELQAMTKQLGGVSAQVPELLADVDTQIRRLNDVVVALRESFPLDRYVEPPSGTAVDRGVREAAPAAP